MLIEDNNPFKIGDSVRLVSREEQEKRMGDALCITSSGRVFKMLEIYPIGTHLIKVDGLKGSWLNYKRFDLAIFSPDEEYE